MECDLLELHDNCWGIVVDAGVTVFAGICKHIASEIGWRKAAMSMRRSDQDRWEGEQPDDVQSHHPWISTNLPLQHC